MTRFHTAIAALFLLALAAAPLSGQRRARPGPPAERQSFFSLQTVNLIADDSTLSRLDILYGFPRNFFVLVRDESSQDPDALTGHGEVIVEIFDRNKTSVARDFFNIDLRGRPAAEAQDSGSVTGIVSFNLRPDEYTVNFEARDIESDRHVADESHKVTLKDFRKSRGVTDIIFVSPSTDLRRNFLKPLNLGGDLPFGGHANAFCEIAPSCGGEPLKGSYTITAPDPETHGVKTWMHDTIPSESFAVLRRLGFPVQAEAATGKGTHSPDDAYTLADTPGSRGSMCAFPVNTDSLPLGRYEILVTVRTCDSTVTATSSFALRWQGMPMSLRSVESAVEPMRYILSEQEFDHLRSASPSEQRRLFDEFWKKKDPTPSTAFNEVLEEFYRRVDHATVEFRTLREENGMKTDRGRAYILYGPPSRVDRDLSPSGPPRETWYYDRLQKKLIFEDESRKGDYVLVSTDTL